MTWRATSAKPYSMVTYAPEQEAMIWKIKSIAGGKEVRFPPRQVALCSRQTGAVCSRLNWRSQLHQNTCLAPINSPTDQQTKASQFPHRLSTHTVKLSKRSCTPCRPLITVMMRAKFSLPSVSALEDDGLGLAHLGRNTS
jgi:hypothetical protein